MVNGPPGTRTSAGPVNGVTGSGSGAVRAAGPRRSWCVISMVSSCCCSCWAIIPKAKPASVSRVPSNAVRSSTSSARPRTSDAYRRASSGDSRGRLGRAARGCSKAS